VLTVRRVADVWGQWQGTSIVETRRADKATRNVGDSVAKYQGRTAAVCDAGLQTVQEMKVLKEACN